VGIAWNSNGEWAARTGTSVAEAQATALQACNDVTTGCVSSTAPVAGDRPMCFAIFRNGAALRSSNDPSLPSAIAQAQQACNTSGAGGPGCYQQIATCNDHPIAAPSTWAWVGIGWNKTGGWATRTATSAQEAQALALLACNKQSGNCFNAQNPIPGERLTCFAIFGDGKDLYEHHDRDLNVAVAEALKSCQGGGNAGACKSQIQACNNRR
jgi:hypothetical protein